MTPVVIINELVAENNNGIVDNTGEFEDWIELHNTSTGAVNLAGWQLSDGDDSYVFPSISVGANDYVVVFASGETARSTANELHLPFKLSANGEPLTLSDAAGTTSLPSFPAPGFPALPADVSFGPDSAGVLRYYASPTPGSVNSSASVGIVAPVTFSVPHGFYTSTQAVIVDTPTSAATIRYTLDGTTPSPTTGTTIQPGQAITVSSTSTIRAIAFRTDSIPSSVETRSYFFTADIITQTSTPAGWPASGAVNGQLFDYGMDPNIVNGNEATVSNSLTSIPSISVVTDQANLTDSNTGIYVNADLRGREWERPASIELIDPTGVGAGFEMNGGLRIRGGGSRRDENPKHSLRLYFRNDYGDGELDYPLFGADGVDSFESLGLATAQNGSWSYRDEDYATWVRDPWVRETQAAMGQPNTDSRYYHVYLNGQYWGLYYSQERLSGAHGVEHFGGSESDYDVVGGRWRAAASASDGSIDDLAALYPIVQDQFITDAEFATLANEVNLENLADYFLLHFFTGDFDASPMGWSDGNERWTDSNNWRGFRNRTGQGEAGKWLFFDHDSEFTLCGPRSPLDVDNTTPWNLTSGTVPDHQVPTPAWLHESLITHPSYQQIFQDRVALHLLTPGGALTDLANQARFDALLPQVSGAIDAEAARWGDALGDPAYDRSDWDANIATLRQCAADRQSVVQAQLEADGLWPSQDAPSITPASGAVPFGTQVSIDAGDSPGTIWYTTNNSDPRNADGTVNPAAQVYAGPITIGAATSLQARVLNGAVWTPLASSNYVLSTPAGPVTLVLNEYNAVSSSKFLGGGGSSDVANGTDTTFGRIAGNGGDWFELLALDTIDVRGWTFEVWDSSDGAPTRSAALTIRSDADALATIAAGTIITISEDIADDLSFSPGTGDWHINLQADSAGSGAYFTTASQQGFAINNDDTEIAIYDNVNTPVALRTGERTAPNAGVNSEEVFKLEATPTTAITPDNPDYADGTTSSWGQPNQWSDAASQQDLSGLRTSPGDVNCDNKLDIGDAFMIAQYSVGSRTAKASCPINNATEIHITTADMNNNGTIDIGDALTAAQCSVGITTNPFCPT